MVPRSMPMFIRGYSTSISAGAMMDALASEAMGGQIDLFGAPALVPQQAARSFPADRNISQQFHRRRIARIELGEAALHAIDDGRSRR